MKINDNTDPAAKGLAAYTIQELYEKYDDYLFDWETFYMDPERYTFTEDDIMYWNLREPACVNRGGLGMSLLPRIRISWMSTGWTGRSAGNSAGKQRPSGKNT